MTRPMVNAAKFSKAPVIDAYCEIRPERVELFVRDRGIGFDPSDVASDRRGIADSIVARLDRVGGMAQVRSALGERVEREVAR